MRSTAVVTNNYRLGFRSDIEGLRAIAIILVVAAHAQVPWLEGGFIGVDVFFVLSGYLITSLLLKEATSSGRIKFLEFYARRLRRLLPALLVVIAVTSICAALLLAPIEQLSQTKSAISASIWSSNLFFAFKEIDYFSDYAKSDPFLHTWSLGVEEQFYLLWPLLISVILLMGSKGRSPVVMRHIQISMFCVVILFFALSLYWTYFRPTWAFYLMPSRAWQFGVGALAASVRPFKDLQSTPITHQRLMKDVLYHGAGWVGIGAVVLASIVLNDRSRYPGLWSTLPTIGTALVLISGTTTNTRAWALGRWLSAKPLQLIGRVSYSWYLWHWPVLILGATLTDFASPFFMSCLVVLSFGLSLILYHFVESPIRRSRALNGRPGAVIVWSVILMATVIALSVTWNGLAKSWAMSPQQSAYQDVRQQMPALYAMGCDEWFHTSRVKVCQFGDGKAPNTAVIFGDSIMAQWFPALSKIYSEPEWRLLVVTKSACPLVDRPFFYARIGRVYKACEIWRNAAIQLLEELKPEIILMGSSAGYSYNKMQWINGTSQVLTRLSPAADKIFLFRAPYSLEFDGPACLARRQWRYAPIAEYLACRSPANDAQNSDVFSYLLSASQPFTNVQLINMNAVICGATHCSAERDGLVVYRDQSHLSLRFVESLVDEVKAKLDSPLNPAP